MKSSLVPIACGTALAVMAGAAAAHWSSVRNLSALASVLPENHTPSQVPRRAAVPALPDESLAREAKHLLAEARRTENQPSRPAKAESEFDARLEKILSVSEGLAEQNAQLRDQMANTNRDMMELQLRVDSYDGQFRPLKVEEETTYYDDDGSSGVLPPLDTP